MKIGIVGAGSVGSALATAFAAKHEVTLGVRETGDAKTTALAAAIGAIVAEPDAAAREADVIILAVPWEAATSAVASLGDLSGKILVDATNPLRMGPGGLELSLGFHTSAAETVAAAANGALVVKAFNQTGANNMDGTAHFQAPPVMFMAGDDAGAKSVVAGLIADAGFQPEDAGGLAAARLLEPLAALWISRAFGGHGRDFAFALVSRT